MKNKAEDYLKYWRVIRQFMKVKYGLSQSDLDVLLFLYSESYFDRDRFDEFNSLLAWDTKRFSNLLKDGWIEIFRKHRGKYKSIYVISSRGKAVVRSIYRKLNGEEIPVSLSQNSMFLKNVSYTDKVYRNMIMKMNEAIRQQRHQTPEE
jgi:predicted transcriptional regulator